MYDYYVSERICVSECVGRCNCNCMCACHCMLPRACQWVALHVNACHFISVHVLEGGL